MNTQPALFSTSKKAAQPKPAGIPTWLQNHLSEKTGDDYSPTGIRRSVRAKPCARCGAWCLAGLDADRCAFEAHADPTRLNADEELACLIIGRHTFEMRSTGENKYKLNRRDRWRIAGHPPDSKTIIAVLPEHVCGYPIGEILKNDQKIDALQFDRPQF